MRIVLTGGGTGGHLIPFEPILEAVRSYHYYNKATVPKRLEPDLLQLYFVGASDEKTKEFFARYDIPVYPVTSGKLRRYFSALTVFDLLFWLPLGMVISLIRMWWIMPDAVISKGGYGSLPVVVASVFYRIPIVLHESDVVMGLANKITARFSQVIALTHEETRLYLEKKYLVKTFITGLPVRSNLNLSTVEEAKRFFNIDLKEPVLLVMGGSQGAQQINVVLIESLASLIQTMSIIHITGEKNFNNIKTIAEEVLASSPRKEAYTIFPYLTDNLPYALVAADVVVTRSGATTLAELAHLHKPALLIPLASSANNHQQKNAELYERYGAARVLESINVTRSLFEHAVRAIMDSPATKTALSEGMAKLDKPDAAQDMAKLVFIAASGFKPTAHDTP